MPTVISSTQVQAYAHCPRPMCDGGMQVPVDAVREEVGTTYIENGGDSPFTERSHVHLAFADGEQQACPSCGHPREVTLQPRVDYQNLSGHDPNGLLGIKYGLQSAEPTPEVALRERVAELERQLAEKAS